MLSIRMLWCFQRAGGREGFGDPETQSSFCGEDNIKVLMQRLQRLEVEAKEVKEELKRRME